MKSHLLENIKEIEITEVSSISELDPDEYENVINKKKSFQRTIDDKIKKSIIDSLYPHEDDVAELYRDDADDCAELLEHWTVKKRTLLHRTFGPLEQGSMRGSIFAMLSSTLGSGMLSLPKTFADNGMLLGMALLFIAAINAVFSMNFLVYASFKTGIINYALLVEDRLGKKTGKLFAFFQVIFLFGVIMSYLILSNISIFDNLSLRFIPVILANFSIIDSDFWEQEWARPILLVLVALIIFPIALIKNLHGLRYFSLVGIASIFYIVAVVVIQSFSYSAIYFDVNKLLLFRWNTITVIKAFTLAIFSYVGHQNIFPLRIELSRPYEHRMKKIFSRSVLIETLLYFFLATAGYLSMLDKTPEIMIQRPPLDSLDVAMLIGKIGLTVNLFFSTPVNLHPARIQILSLLGKDFGHHPCWHFSITFGLLFGATFTAIVYPNIISALSFLGGTTGTLMSITFPALLFILTNGKPRSHIYNILLFLYAVSLTVLGFLAAFISLLEPFFA